MKYQADGTQLFYDEVGSGPAVMLLHPTPVDHGFWLPVAREWLAPKYRVLLPDLRGHGQSELGRVELACPEQGSPAVLTVEQLAGDVLRLLDVLGIERAAFGGCSIGSYVLYEIWRQVPERVTALAFCCGKPQGDTAANRLNRERWNAEIEARGTAGFFDVMLATLVGEPSVAEDPAILIRLRAMMERMTPEAVMATQRGLALRPDSLGTAASIRVPTAVLAGALDTSSTPEEMQELASAIADAQFHLLSETGHYAPYERPKCVGKILRGFLDGVSWEVEA